MNEYTPSSFRKQTIFIDRRGEDISGSDEDDNDEIEALQIQLENLNERETKLGNHLSYLEEFLFKEKMYNKEKNSKKAFLDDTESSQYLSVKNVFSDSHKSIY